jgi:tetratricopeptide (TPR) repeat protein
MCIAFKYLEKDDLKSHYTISSILYSTVDKVFNTKENPLKLGLAKFHHAKCMKDYNCNYSLSMNLFLESIQLIEKANEGDSQIGIQIKFFLGNLYNDMGMEEQGITTLREVLDKQIKMFTEEHTFTARTYNCLGIAEDNRNNFKQAREYYQKAYTIFKHLSYGLETIDSAKVLNNLAGIYFKWDDFTSSIKFYLKVLEVYLNKYSENNSYVAITYYNLGNCYLMTNSDTKALDYLKKAKEIFTKELGPSHPQTAMSCKTLGDLYYGLKDYKDALEMYNLCINTFLEKYGGDNDLYISTLSK